MRVRPLLLLLLALLLAGAVAALWPRAGSVAEASGQEASARRSRTGAPSAHTSVDGRAGERPDDAAVAPAPEQVTLVRGRVLVEGIPTEGVVVTASAKDPAHDVETLSGPEGVFTLPLPVPGDYGITTPQPEYVGNEPLIDAREPPEEVILRLFHPRRLTGRVVREGRPAEGVEVTISQWEQAGATRTNPEGAFTFDRLLPGDHTLRATASLLAAMEMAHVPLQGEAAPVTLSLSAAGEIVGTVTGPSGRPEPGVTLSVEDSRVEANLPEATSGPDGRYRLGPLPPGEYTFEVSAGMQWEMKPARSLVVMAGQTSRVDVALTPSIEVRGRVVDETGRPVADARLSVRSDWWINITPDEDRTDADGRFRIQHGLGAGPAQLTVTHEEHRRLERPLTLPTPELTLVLQRGSALSGRVLDAWGAPVKDAEIRISSAAFPTTKTDAQGAFRFTGLPPGSYELLALRVDAPAGCARSVVEVPERGELSTTLRMEAKHTLSGLVVDERGQPVEGVRVEPWKDLDSRFIDDEGWMLRQFSVTTDARGRFTLSGLPDGSYRLAGMKEGYEEGALRGARLEEGAAPVRMVMNRIPQLRFRVVHEDRSPVTLFVVNGQEVRSPDGSQRVQLHGPGELELWISANGLAPAVLRLRVAEPKDLELPDLVLRAGRPVTGRVVHADTGAPFSGVKLKVLAEGEGRAYFSGAELSQSSNPLAPDAVTGDDGRFTLPHVVEGNTVRLHGPNRKRQFVPLQPGADMTLRL